MLNFLIMLLGRLMLVKLLRVVAYCSWYTVATSSRVCRRQLDTLKITSLVSTAKGIRKVTTNEQALEMIWALALIRSH